MSEETKSVPTQEAQETVAKNESASPSDANLMHELMKYKTQRNELRDEISSYKAEEEKRRAEKMEEQGELKQLISEMKQEREKDKKEITQLRELKQEVKTDLINSLTSDEEKKEILMSKDLDTLKFLKSEKNSMSNSMASNPTESLGAVRSKPLTTSTINKMSAEEKRANWPEITEFFKSQG
jgi:seryl-tRNA synthetase